MPLLDQGSFTPGTLTSSTLPVVPGSTAGDRVYQHGMFWTASANGFLQGRPIAAGELAYATQWADREALHFASSMTWDIGMNGGFPLSLDCEQLVVRLDLQNPANPEYGDVALWDVSTWDDVEAPSYAVWGSIWDDWTDISKYIRGVKIQRGRTSSWNDIQVGSATIEVDNASGYFSVYSDIGSTRFQLNTGLYIGAIWRGVEYPQFTGGIREFNEDDQPGLTGAVFNAFDATSRLTDARTSEYNPGAPADRADIRIGKLLDMNSLNNEPRELEPGRATMTNYKSMRNLLDEIRLTAMSDGGLFYADVDGVLKYLNRTRISGRNSKNVPYFSDACDDGGLPYAAIELVWNDFEFGNVVIVSNVSQGSESNEAIVVSDDVSISKYGRVTWSPSQLVITNAEYLADLAQWELERRSTSWYRVNKFEAYPAHDDRIWAALLNMRLNYPLTIERTPPGNAQPLVAEFLCDGMVIEGTPEMWKFTVYCSPAKNIYGRRYGDLKYGDDLYGRFVT